MARVDEISIERARHLRKNMRIPGAKLWKARRMLRSQGHHFHRQVEIGNRYYVDFCCHAAGLIIEVDGVTHYVGSEPARDYTRDAFLAGQGYRVPRIPNNQVTHNLDGVMMLVLDALATDPTHPSP